MNDEVLGNVLRVYTRIALGAGSVWHLSGLSRIARFDPRTGEAKQLGAEEFLLVFQDGIPTQLTDVALRLRLALAHEQGGKLGHRVRPAKGTGS